MDIAVIGMACRFPGAENYHEFWENLEQGRSSITTIPLERWNWQDFYGDPAKEENKMDNKWGGFVKDIDKFDSFFFNISPKEAGYTDPQHRLFLESAWHAIEDAGYRPSRLAGKKIGLYAGVSKNDYAELMRENHETILSFVSTGTVHSILANRVSFLLDFHGKSEVVDTACSSFLVALYNAVRDIRSGGCEAAIVGGVNAILTPTMYISHSKSGMLSKEGRCKTFDAGADGYVRGEGVGVVFIKPLEQALADEDYIVGVIKGSAVQHGGRSNFLTSPNVLSQVSVITEALEDAGVRPQSIGYMEAHGTATPLGDPVEINALKTAYQPWLKGDEGPFCGLGSAKTNIGHLESAAGVAGLIKVLLCFKHQKIPPLLHFKKLNPYIELDGSPFFIDDKLRDWTPLVRDNRRIPLRAGLSAFGMGGVNAHVILEAPPERPAKNHIGNDQHFLILLSAKKGRLKACAERLLIFLRNNGSNGLRIEDVAFTLMFGRDEMDERLAFLARTISDVTEALLSYLNDEGSDTVYQGLLKKDADKGSVAGRFSDDLSGLAQQWVMGTSIKWVVDDYPGRKIPLPTYPFARRRCWFGQGEPDRKAQNMVYKTILPDDQIVADHRVQTEKILPGAAYLELMRAVLREHGDKAIDVKNTYWLSPLHFTDQARELSISIETDSGQRSFRVSTEEATHCSGQIAKNPARLPSEKLDIPSLAEDCPHEIEKNALYSLFVEHGLDYGPAFQVLNRFQWREDAAVAEFNGRKEEDVGLLDGVFQAAAALSIKNGTADDRQHVPFFLEHFRSSKSPKALKYVYVKQKVRNGEKGTTCQFDMYGCDADGWIVTRFENFTKRGLKETSPAAEKMLYYTPRWSLRSCEIGSGPMTGVLMVNANEQVDKIFPEECFITRLQLDDHYETISAACSELFATLKAERKTLSHIIVQSTRPGSKDLCLLLLLTQSWIKAKIRDPVQMIYLAECGNVSTWPSVYAVGGFARTLKFENAGMALKVVGLDGGIEQYLDFLEDEVRTVPGGLHEIQYRSGQRWSREIQPVTGDLPTEAAPVKEGGTYLIAGGAGGLGRIFAAYLARTYRATLILLGRRRPDKEIEMFLERVRRLGGNAEYHAVDIRAVDDLKRTLSGIRKKQRPIHGVIHAGGVLEDSFILRYKVESFEKVLGPKLEGTVNLDTATARDDLDFFVMFSSVASLMPNQGQCSYASGNSFMDYYADYRGVLVSVGKRSGVSLAINWPLWAEGGMQVTEEERTHLLNEFGMKPLTTVNGIELFNTALCAAQCHAYCQFVGIQGQAEKIKRSFKIHVDQIPSEGEEDPANLLLQDLKIVVAETLKKPLPQIADKDRFQSWGIDSAGMIGISEGINEILDAHVKPTLFFECATLTDVAEKLLKERHEKVIRRYAGFGSLSPRHSSMGLLDVEKSSREKGLYQRRYTNREFYMVDHVVEGQYNVPGACYIEMARQAASLAQPTRVVEKLTNNYWAKQLSSHGDPFTAYVRLTDLEGVMRYEIFSLAEDDREVLHATGDIAYAQTGPTLEKNARLDLAAIRRRCPKRRTREEVYQQIHAEGLKVGPTFMPMREFIMNEREALALLALPEEITDTRGDYLLHPTLLTGVFQTALLNNRFHGNDDKNFIPMAIERVELKGCIPETCYVYSEACPSAKRNPDLKKFNLNVCDEHGRVVLRLEHFVIKAWQAQSPRSVAAKKRDRARTPVAEPSSSELHHQVEAMLIKMMAPVIGVEPEEIDPKESFERYGIGSVMILDLNKIVEETFGRGHSKTLFFENKNVSELTDYFLEEHKAAVMAQLGPSMEPPVREKTKEREVVAETPRWDEHRVSRQQDAVRDIAVIGLAGRYPKAATMEELWDNLKQGRDCIEEIPRNRFDYAVHYDPDRKNGGLYGKWGSFIDDVDTFDPLFFNISPREAERMDPQERLLLQTAWEALEDAGYTREELTRISPKVGVFVGALWQPYTALGVEATAGGHALGPSGLLYNTANRISYFCDFRGPSLAVDTACSASLTALHLACRSIRQGECRAALVGGVNLSLDESKFLFLSQYNFLSTEGKCRSFGEGGDGYVPGEGVGAVLLKPLADAVQDGDHIYGVIKGTAINHGGKTNGYTVPRPQAQADVIAEALQEAEVDPREIGYIEAHGTGTALGDPIEIDGLTKAFSVYTSDKQFCAIGSIKSNIGHLEANAGLAGLTKILLQFKHRKLLPSIHSEALNPNIDFARTPFYVQRDCVDWTGRTKRRAALSSFGAGGSNAHVILEEYVRNNECGMIPLRQSFGGHVNDEEAKGAYLIVLSAKTEGQLKEMARNLQRYVTSNPECGDPNLRALAYTLQVGREGMAHRVAFLAKDAADLIAKLNAFGESETKKETWYGSEGSAGALGRMGIQKDEDFQSTMAKWIEKGKLRYIAELWVQGFAVDWNRLYNGVRPHRISLPTYPFLKESYWLPTHAPECRGDSKGGTPEYTLHLFTSGWVERPIRAGGEALPGSGPLIFISTLDDRAMAQRLKVDYPQARILNVKRTLSFDDSFSLTVYEHIFETLKQLLEPTKRNPGTVVFLTHEEQMPFYEGFTSFLKTLLVENVIRRAKYLVFPREASDEKGLLDRIRQEMGAWESAFGEVCYRPPEWRRWVKEYQKMADQEWPDGRNPLLRNDGVYWITGGLGRLGRIFVDYLAEMRPGVKLIVSGRRSERDAHIGNVLEVLRKQGIAIRYLQGDVADRQVARDMVRYILREYQTLNGIIHAAGLIRDAFFYAKTAEGVRDVLRPKIAGAVHLDACTKELPLDFFCCFSSVSSVFGNTGQSDYALANGFMDAFAAYRRQLVDAGARSGKTISINWPLWQDGGMQVDQHVVTYLKDQWGTVPLPTDMGRACFDRCLAAAHTQSIPLFGIADRIAAHILEQKAPESKKYRPQRTPTRPINESPLEHLEAHIKGVISELLKLKITALDSHTDIKEYGFDSITLNGLAQSLSTHYHVEIVPGLFYECDSVAKIAVHIASHADMSGKGGTPDDPASDEDAKQTERTRTVVRYEWMASPHPPLGQTDIAIIGLDGRFPGAENVETFWNNMICGHVAVSDLLEDGFRFNDEPLEPFKRFGGALLPDIDRFDAAFFAINEAEARLMDPQQRLLLESVWRVVEDAGYRMDELSEGQTGLFVGVGSSDYLQLMCAAEQPSDSRTQVGLSQSMLANRISYQLNLRGPSEICDTACSSSIVAVHRAVRSLQEGECELALAAGVNLLLSSRGYLGLKDLGFLSPSRSTRSFDARADGYVRGEGVGTVLLKPLVQAERDRDHIYGVIKGSAVYHGGRSDLSLVAPSKNGQVEAMVRAYRAAGIDPATVRYVEAHGTGTQFGDSAEVSALKKAFSALRKRGPNGDRCGIGSLKPNIGHLEAASGIAGLIKLVMALKNRTIPPLTGFETLHPGVQLEESPFYIVKTPEEWEVSAHDSDHPRRAGLNAYGFGGVNAHLVLEEYLPPNRQASAAHEIIALSANHPRMLERKARDLREFLKNRSESLALKDISYTLCTGRVAGPVRLAVIAQDVRTLIERLEQYRNHPNCLYGELKPELIEEELFGGGEAPSIQAGSAVEDAKRIARRWVEGRPVDWSAWFAGQTPYKTTLPTHCFEGRSYWYNQCDN